MNPDAQPSDSQARLDNLTLARKEGWKKFVDTPARRAPEQLTRKQIRALGEGVRFEYERARRIWHANLGPIKTPQLAELHEDLWDILDSNLQDGDKPKGAVAIDAFPGLGKTTSVLAQLYTRATVGRPMRPTRRGAALLRALEHPNAQIHLDAAATRGNKASDQQSRKNGKPNVINYRQSRRIKQQQ